MLRISANAFVLVGLLLSLALAISLNLVNPTPRALAAGCPYVGTPPAAPRSWPMFHRDALHTGALTETAGNIVSHLGPTVRWKYKVFDVGPSPTLTDLDGYRWASSFPLGDLDGDGKLDVLVTAPNGPDGFANRIIALKDTPNEAAPVRAMWTFTYSMNPSGGLDMYSPALADANGDGLLDVIATTSDGHLLVLRGCDGTPLWDPPYEMNHIVESGPMLADLFGDGKKEIIVTTAGSPSANCGSGLVYTGGPDCGALYVFALTDTVGVTNHLIFSQSFTSKMDSAVPAIADVDPEHGTKRKVMFIGTWGGVLMAAWRSSSGTLYTETLNLSTLVSPAITLTTPVIRSSPLVWDFGEGPEVIFGWMPDHNAGGEARISAVKVRANMLDNSLVFTPTWTINRQAWKSSPALLPVSQPPLVVDGWGAGVPSNPPLGQGSVTSCGSDSSPLTGGLIALRVTGADDQRVAWEKIFGPSEGYRNFAAVADLNGDGRQDVIVANQCFGKIHSFDGLDGTEQWSFQLGPYLFASPTIGDLQGDGKLEIIESSLDGYVWALGGGSRSFVPLIFRGE
jgi:outer membrane protein assembly factor BamB